MYSVKSASVLTGLSADILRAWERRYQVVTPTRDKNDRRVYGPEDIVRLRLLASGTNMGHPISKLALLENDELRAFLNAGKGIRQEKKLDLAVEVVDAAKLYRLDLVDEILGSAIVGLPPLRVACDVLIPTLNEVGDLWHNNEITIAQEHLISTSIERVVLSAINIYQKTANGPKILFATFSGETHGFGILLSAFIAASLHIRCYYVGPDLPAEEIVKAGKDIGIEVIALSFIVHPISDEHTTLLNNLCKEMDGHSQVWVGGVAATRLPLEAVPENCVIIQNLDDFNDRIDFLLNDTR